MVDLRRPLERGLIKEGSEKDIIAVKEILNHLLELVGVQKDKKTPTVRAVIGIPAEAMRVNKQHLRNALQGTVDSLMIVSEPFAVAYGLDALLHSLVIDIGAGTTDFCVMRGRLPTEDDQRTLTVAGDSIDDLLLKLILQKFPDAQITVFMVRQWKEKHGFVGKPQQPVKVTAPVKGRPTELDITEAMKAACESIVEPIAETLLDLLPRIEPEFQEQVRNSIILSGGTSQIAGLRKALQDALEPLGGGSVKSVKNPVFDGSDGGLAIALDALDSEWDQLT
jgi:rod shape-determining protein MreB